MSKKSKQVITNVEKTQIFLVSLIASLLSGVILITFQFVITEASVEQKSLIYGIGIFVILAISIIAAIRFIDLESKD